MKLVTFQTMDALKKLIQNEYLECDQKFININKAGTIYSWVINKMNQIILNQYDAKYPLWCWVKFKNGICPPKHKGEPIKGFEVKITFHKNEKDVFITDFRRYSFLLNNKYIPENKADKELFEQELKKYNITDDDLKAYVRLDKFEKHRTDVDYLKICQRIKDSFDKCITSDSDVLQGCVWRINLSDVEQIEILNNTNYTYGSFNYIRSNGQRFNWIEDFYKNMKQRK